MATGATFDLNNFSQSIGSLAGAGSVTLGTSTLITGNNNISTDFSGVIGGLGGLTKVGTGTQTLSGENTYFGGTTISNGTLQLGNGGTSGSIVGDVVNNATFAVNRSDTFTFGGVISGTGAFQQLGTGTTVLTGANTYSGGDDHQHWHAAARQRRRERLDRGRCGKQRHLRGQPFRHVHLRRRHFRQRVRSSSSAPGPPS